MSLESISLSPKDSGELFSWGNNDFGQLGRSGRQFVAQRVDALETMRITQVACGGRSAADYISFFSFPWPSVSGASVRWDSARELRRWEKGQAQYEKRQNNK